MFFSPKMQIYTVHVKAELPDADEKTIFIPETFNWKAFAFGIVWTLYHRLWLVSIALFLLICGLMYVGENGYLNEISAIILQIALSLYVGFNANDWKRNKLTRLGFIASELVASDNIIRAQQRYFEHKFS